MAETPRVRGRLAEIKALEGQRHEWDKFWMYQLEVYLPADGDKPERVVYEFKSIDLYPPATFYSEFEAGKACSAKALEVVAMLCRMANDKGFDGYIDLKTGQFKKLPKGMLK